MDDVYMLTQIIMMSICCYFFILNIISFVPLTSQELILVSLLFTELKQVPLLP